MLAIVSDILHKKTKGIRNIKVLYRFDDQKLRLERHKRALGWVPSSHHLWFCDTAEVVLKPRWWLLRCGDEAFSSSKAPSVLLSPSSSSSSSSELIGPIPGLGFRRWKSCAWALATAEPTAFKLRIVWVGFVACAFPYDWPRSIMLELVDCWRSRAGFSSIILVKGCCDWANCVGMVAALVERCLESEGTCEALESCSTFCEAS